MRVCSLNLVSFTRHVSITNTTSGIVTPVSAIFVANTILRIPDGGVENASCCCAILNELNNGTMRYLFRFAKVRLPNKTSWSRVISPIPGRNINTAPSISE